MTFGYAIRLVDNGQNHATLLVQRGYIWTNAGTPIPVYKVYGQFISEKGGDDLENYKDEDGAMAVRKKPIQETLIYKSINEVSYLKANCYGNAILNDEYYVPNDIFIKELVNDDYTLIKGENSNKKIEYKKNDIVVFGAFEHIVKATGQKNSKGEMIFESHFALNQQGTIKGTLQEIRDNIDANVEGVLITKLIITGLL